jgi:DNA-binding CsgD family transcriptional regulator
MGHSADFVRLVEAAYDLDGNEADWMRGLVDVLQPDFDRGFGVVAFTHHRQPDGSMKVGTPVAVGPSWLAPLTLEVNSSPPQDTLSEVHGHTIGSARPFATFSEMLERSSQAEARSVPERVAQAHGLTFRDFVGIVASDPTGSGLTLGALLPERSKTTKRERHHFGCAAAHIAAAMRLRCALSSEASAEEAVLTPEGGCLHAETPAKSAGARARLRESVLKMERARGNLRKTDPAEALALWQGLCGGRWSLVDRFDSDGRRFVIARRNEPDFEDPRALSRRERQALAYAAMGYTNKYIAYALGLSPSSIAMHLGSAARKLRATSKVHLVEMAARLGCADGFTHDGVILAQES